MRRRDYHCLVSGLPDLVLEQSRNPVALTELVEELRAALHPDDAPLLRLLLLQHDHHNLLRLLSGDCEPWDRLGTCTPEELASPEADGSAAPPYVARFLRAHRDGAPLWPELAWADQLARLYYEYASKRTVGFLHAWLLFERNVGSLLAAWNARELGEAPSPSIVAGGAFADALRHSTARDFGLSREFGWVHALMLALEREDLVEREYAIDHVKWNVIDELNTFHYFTVEIVLGYFLKSRMVDRWLRLDPVRGAAGVDGALASMGSTPALAGAAGW